MGGASSGVILDGAAQYRGGLLSGQAVEVQVQLGGPLWRGKCGRTLLRRRERLRGTLGHRQGVRRSPAVHRHATTAAPRTRSPASRTRSAQAVTRLRCSKRPGACSGLTRRGAVGEACATRQRTKTCPELAVLCRPAAGNSPSAGQHRVDLSWWRWTNGHVA